MSTRLLYVCEGGDCTEHGSGDIYHKIKECIEAEDPTQERVKVRRFPCFGGCEEAINVTVFPDRLFYSHVTETDVPEIVDHLLHDGNPVERLCGHVKPDVEEIVWDMLDSPY
ncbi:MAG: (2Fe-2S) ferredoxin domain-containing protein [Planctomycetes bacterium]|nr:(2Fe-2S) ferredoxin domain-containing protein [Planctomycetota bacterium]